MKPSSLLCWLVALLALTQVAQARPLRPGFEKAEYLELLRLHARMADTSFFGKIPRPSRFRRAYRSPVLGLDNSWELWTSPDSVAVVSIRGTTANSVSWLENFYAAMLPAKGELRLSPSRTFPYELSSHPQAAVHAGWLLGMAYLSDGIVQQLDSCYRRGIRDVVVMGHSQGGGIAYLLTSHVRALQRQQKLPADIRLKTYCSAGPKPGNLYYAYDYEAQAQTALGSWACNVVNSADWVPEVPISIQTIQDFNPTNPFVGAKHTIGKQKFSQRLVLRYLYNQLERPTRKAQRAYQKYLGTLVGKQVTKQLPGYQPSSYYPSSHYVRTGSTIVLAADKPYYQLFPDEEGKIFRHHLFEPYYYLAEKLP
ncbi:lipase family protein [Hymenobacter tibetensis]|uniref:Lipase family protein n=1 Tax=Hymenobacter tibetensis TaxID=497967 RepID=A0ABY4D0N3_9BACT|nr:lipase family protein [Hymenobacter tibetensis]UOG76060.1 lipase family protein [Hymenobacter tibetensis]